MGSFAIYFRSVAAPNLEKSPLKVSPRKTAKGKRKVSSSGGLSSSFAETKTKLTLQASVSIFGAVVEKTNKVCLFVSFITV